MSFRHSSILITFKKGGVQIGVVKFDYLKSVIKLLRILKEKIREISPAVRRYLTNYGKNGRKSTYGFSNGTREFNKLEKN